MFSGFENYFVLEKIFGQVDIFSGAELNALNIFWGNSQINLELKTASAVISMPKRWKQTQAERTHGVYVYFTLHCITALEVNFDDFGFDLNKPLKIVSGKAELCDTENRIELLFENNQWFRCRYKVGIIQNTSNKAKP